MIAMEIVGDCSFMEQGYRTEVRVVRMNRDAVAAWKATGRKLTRQDFDTPEQYNVYCQEQNAKRCQFIRMVFDLFGVDLYAPDVDGTVSHVLDDIFTVMMMKEAVLA